jgi:hypothetical protein
VVGPETAWDTAPGSADWPSAGDVTIAVSKATLIIRDLRRRYRKEWANLNIA